MDSRNVIKLLKKDGWVLVRIKGDHYHFKHPTKPGIVTIPLPIQIRIFQIGDTLEEAIQSAHNSLVGYLLTAEDFGEKVPDPSPATAFSVSSPDFLSPIPVNLRLEREKEQNTLVKKTLTIPSYLNELGKENGLNFSALLTQALKDKLNV